MLSSGRCSSCSLALGDGPDFLDFAVNEPFVDEESEFMFPVLEERKCGVHANDHNDAKKEFHRLKNRAAQNSPTLQERRGHESRSKKQLATAEKMDSFGNNERKSSTAQKLPTSEQGKTSASELNKGKTTEILDLKRKDKIPEARGTFKEFEAVTKSAAMWKGRVFTERHYPGMEISLNRNKRTSVRKLGNWSLLGNMPKDKDKYFWNHRKLGFYDIATNLYAQKKESKIDSGLDSLDERSGAWWLQNTARSNKTELPPIDFASSRRYSSHWMPQKSIPLRAENNVFNECSNFKGRKQSDLNSIALKSVLQTLDATHLDGQSRAELLKHSLSSLNRNSKQANFKKKALPLVKSALAFKHHGNKSV
ncbi:uncharacterized protein LOC144633012 [Oculina patagonica]